jgi:hypothetical protein
VQCGALIPVGPSGAPAMIPQGSPGAAGPVENYMTQAILVTLFCCTPLGIVGIFKARAVNKALERGDIAGAVAASESAKNFLLFGFIAGLLIIAASIVSNLSSSH